MIGAVKVKLEFQPLPKSSRLRQMSVVECGEVRYKIGRQSSSPVLLNSIIVNPIKLPELLIIYVCLFCIYNFCSFLYSNDYSIDMFTASDNSLCS